LEKQEQEALQVLKNLEIDYQNAQEELNKVNRDIQELTEQEDRYWKEMNELEMDNLDHQQDLESIHLQCDLAKKRLEILSNTNVYNDTFRIWHDGPFGTINGLRLGRLPNKPVEWIEINAGIGQACLLLDSLALKIQFRFPNYKLIPLGSTSKIEKLDGDKAVYELYHLFHVDMVQVIWQECYFPIEDLIWVS
jgi:beclin 1